MEGLYPFLEIPNVVVAFLFMFLAQTFRQRMVDYVSIVINNISDISL